MSKDEIVEAVIRLLRLHKENLHGSVHQDPYMRDLFRQFASAFNAGYLKHSANTDYLSAEVLREIIEPREPELLDQEAWRHLYTFWQEWTYAWKHLGLKN
jgi:hypothetical protein